MMDNEAASIQNSELEVMRVLWDAGGTLPLSEIRAALTAKRGWDDSTTKTLLRRLQAKGAVALQRRGVYSALLSEGEYQGSSTRRFIERLYGGSAKRLVAALVSDGSLSEEDIAELSAMFRVEVDGDG